MHAAKALVRLGGCAMAAKCKCDKFHKLTESDLVIIADLLEALDMEISSGFERG